MILDFIFARDFALARTAWIVVVVPPEAYEEAKAALVAVAGSHPFGGRTLVLPDGGRVSAVRSSDEVFIPSDQPFHTLFAGWGATKATQAQEMVRWRTAARSTVTRTA